MEARRSPYSSAVLPKVRPSSPTSLLVKLEADENPLTSALIGIVLGAPIASIMYSGLPASESSKITIPVRPSTPPPQRWFVTTGPLTCQQPLYSSFSTKGRKSSSVK